nr:isoform 2 of probable inactive 1-aminocyclopropane-1-carboxylate synthase-like protein 2 [Quercus suber]
MSDSAGYISGRVLENLVPNRLDGVGAHVAKNQYDAISNSTGVVAMAVAENKLMQDEVTAHITESLTVTPRHLTYGEGAIGMLALRTTLARYIEDKFKPNPGIPVEAEHITVCSGTSSALSNLAFCIAEPGDAILVARPLYAGFVYNQNLSKVRTLPVAMRGVDPLSIDAIQHYEHALQSAAASGINVRAVLISNPHNPLGRPYSRESLEAHLRFCGEHHLHLISDEIFAESSFSSPVDFPSGAEPFTSVLSLDPSVPACRCDPSLIHVIYGMSKDFCCSGLRVGCIISPSNARVVAAVRSIAVFSRTSSLAEQTWLNFLRDARWLHDRYFPEMHRRLGAEYAYATARLRAHAVPYAPACYTSFLWIDLSAFLHADSEDAELALNWRLARAGVWVALGTVFGAEAFGWVRLTFAIGRGELELGLDRLLGVLREITAEKDGCGKNPEET